MASDRVKSLEKTLTWLNLETITAFKKGRRIKEERRRKKKKRKRKKNRKISKKRFYLNCIEE